ncbi:hypothetical protein H2204_008685 [Knufia peltigerae]|uniref:Uncharacterized protein n=1 Tax=Knufia peltigerae TaxID=1002370 RepID=A0AA38XZJ6_9EURO|nr:hypothetical protein H2204_008685 [Knufia peltigerae]
MAQSNPPGSIPAVLERFLVTGKTVVVTGGARGLGFAFSKGLAQAGANIAVIDRDEAAPPYFDQLSQAGGQHKYYKADVTDYEGLKATIDRISKDFGSINGW